MQRGEQVRRDLGELQPTTVHGERDQEHERERAGGIAVVVEDVRAGVGVRAPLG